MRDVGPGAAATPKVLLLSMPWTSLNDPALGLAILKAKLRQEGIACTVAHLNMFLLKYLKPESYDRISTLYALNDFMFTRVFEGEVVADDQIAALAAMIRKTYDRPDFLARGGADPIPGIEYALRVRNDAVPRYLADCLQVVARSGATMVGFTCLFDQTIASLALAKLVKETFPEKLIALGGYALYPPVGPQLIQCFPFVDVVTFGDGEDVIAPLARASVRRDLLAEVPGIIYRDARGEVCASPAAPRPDLDASPTPEYDDFFADIARLHAEEQVEVQVRALPLESARGCWWGETSHCVFCGIDEETMRYRFKSPERVEQMLRELADRYGIRFFRFCDYILPRSYYKTLLPSLAAQGAPYELHWEIKANLRYEDVVLMRRAGFHGAQPGIESFSTSVLRKMAKGVTGIQNVLTIRLLMEYEITVYYNFLYGFPTDEPDEYRELCRQLPLLYHLTPPVTFLPVLTTRYAPMHSAPERFGIARRPVHDPAYEMIFSKSFRDSIGFELDDYAYLFKPPGDPRSECVPFYHILVYQLLYWTRSSVERDVQLAYRIDDEGVEFADSRYGAEPQRSRFGRDHAIVYAGLTRAPRTADQLEADLEGKFSRARIDTLLGDLTAARVLFQEGQRFVGVALPETFYERRAVREAQARRTRERNTAEIVEA